MTGTPHRTRRPTHPGAVLRNTVLPALKMSVAEAAQALGISRQTLHRIVAEKSQITPDMAVRIGKFCGNGAELWLGMQQAVDLWDARQNLATAIDKIPTPKVAA
jgi:antitoxin HigA-1